MGNGLLPDGMLYRALFEYRYALRILHSAVQPDWYTGRKRSMETFQDVEGQMHEMIRSLEQELMARGLDVPLA